MAVFLGIRVVITVPAVSIPSERGATSITSIEFVYSLPSPDKIAAWTAAP